MNNQILLIYLCIGAVASYGAYIVLEKWYPEAVPERIEARWIVVVLIMLGWPAIVVLNIVTAYPAIVREARAWRSRWRRRKCSWVWSERHWVRRERRRRMKVAARRA